MSKYIIRDREAGNVIDTFNSLTEAQDLVTQWEEEDRADGIFVQDFYEVVEAE